MGQQGKEGVEGEHFDVIGAGGCAPPVLFERPCDPTAASGRSFGSRSAVRSASAPWRAGDMRPELLGHDRAGSPGPIASEGDEAFPARPAVLRTGVAAADAQRAPRGHAAADRCADAAGARESGPVRLVIIGEPASKANSRRLVVIAGRPSSIKSEKALAYERDALKQIPPMARRRFSGPVRVTLRIFYATELPDLDESLILDILQDRYAKPKNLDRHLVQAGVYRNDRQVREKHVFHAIDKRNPRAEIEVEPIQPQQAELL